MVSSGSPHILSNPSFLASSDRELEQLEDVFSATKKESSKGRKEEKVEKSQEGERRGGMSSLTLISNLNTHIGS